MLNKNLLIFSALLLKSTPGFALPDTVSLKNTIMQKMFSKKQWEIYKPRLINSISKIPNDLFANRIFKKIDLRGLPLQGKCFKECKFVEVDFRNMDLSQTTFDNCKFKNVKIDGVQLKDGYVFKDSTSHIELIDYYSNLMASADQFKSERLDKISEECYLRAKQFNDLIFKAAEIKLESLNLENFNLKGIHLEKATFKKVTFENCNLEEAKFHHSKLIDVSLENADLTTTSFEKTKFQNVNLNQVTLCERFKLDSDLTDEGYVRLYADLKSKRENQKAQALNKILPSIRLQLHHKDLSNLNLSGIDLSNANLYYVNFSHTDLTNASLANTYLNQANLQNVKLSPTLVLQYEKFSDLFYQWTDASEEDKPLYQKLVNARVKLFDSLSNEDFVLLINLRDTAQILDLSNADLSAAPLQNINLKNINLKKANLNDADLTNTSFIGAKLSKIKLSKAKFNQTKFSETLTLNVKNTNEDTRSLFYIWIGPKGKDQKISQYLVNSRFNIFKKVTHQELKDYFDQRDSTKPLNLKNADLHKLDLHEINFKGANLKYADLTNANLTNANLTQVNLQVAVLNRTILMGANLTQSNLTNASLLADLTNANLTQANLTNAELIYCTLKNTNFNQAILTETDLHIDNQKEINNINLDGAEVKNIILTHTDDGEPNDVLNYENSNELFDLWINGEEAYQDFCQILVNSQFNLFKDVPHEKLKAFFNDRDHTQPLNLTNANLFGTDLHDIDFTGVILTGANLIEANLKGCNLKGVDLRGGKLSSTFTVLENYSDQDLLNCYTVGSSSLNQETKRALKTVLVAKGLRSEVSEPFAKRIKTR